MYKFFIRSVMIDGYEYDVCGVCETPLAPFFYDYYDIFDADGQLINDSPFLYEPDDDEVEEEVRFYEDMMEACSRYGWRY